MIKPRFGLSLFLLLVFALAGCVPAPSTKPPASAMSLAVAPTSTGTQSSVPTPTLIPPPTSVPTFTAIPTLIPPEAAEKIAELMQTKPDCSKPCFWGITPGRTAFDDATGFVDLLGRKALAGSNKDSSKYYNVILHYKDVVIIGLVLTEKNGIVQIINSRVDGMRNPAIRSSDWLAFRLETILETYGTPSSIKIALAEGQNGVILYELIISYETSSLFLVYYPEDIGHRPDPVLRTCPLAEGGIDRFDFLIGKRPDVPSGYSIEEVTNLSVDQFTKLLIEKKEKACFDFNISSFYK